jgi:hypothetical protein
MEAQSGRVNVERFDQTNAYVTQRQDVRKKYGQSTPAQQIWQGVRTNPRICGESQPNQGSQYCSRQSKSPTEIDTEYPIVLGELFILGPANMPAT